MLNARSWIMMWKNIILMFNKKYLKYVPIGVLVIALLLSLYKIDKLKEENSKQYETIVGLNKELDIKKQLYYASVKELKLSIDRQNEMIEKQKVLEQDIRDRLRKEQSRNEKLTNLKPKDDSCEGKLQYVDKIFRTLDKK